MSVQTAAIAVFIDEGNSIEYTPVSALNAGDVVDLGTCVGITLVPIAAGVVGALRVKGKFLINKRTSTTASLGDKVYWDVSTSTVSTNASYNDAIVGYCAKAALAGDAQMMVNLQPNFA